MSSKKNINIYAPSDKFIYMTMKNFSWGILGLVFGMSINNIVIYLSKTLIIEKLLLQNILQILLCALLLSTLHYYHNYFGWTLQNNTEGLFFVSFFFGVQFKVLSNIQSVYEIKK
jgi:hypothetical protein